MSRNIIAPQKRVLVASDADVPFKSAATPPAADQDTYTSKIIKMIPADIISVYLGVFTIIKNTDAQTSHTILQWIVFGAVLLITPFYLWKVAGITSKKQVMVCTLSFLIWVFSIGGPLDGQMIGGYTVQFLGAIILPVYTLFIPLVYKN